jgi:hypothetical protein
MVIISSCRLLLICRWVECMRVTFVLLKPNHNSAITMSDVNMMG